MSKASQAGSRGRTAWNVGRNALRPAQLRVMVGKVVKRFEPDTRVEARAWAAQRAVDIGGLCESLDAALWAESVDAVHALERDARERLASVPYDLGGGGAYPLLYFLVRLRRPRVVVETGVAAGWSSRAFLAALERNGEGELWSSDFPYFRLEHPERFIGVVVPPELRGRWHLDIRGDRTALPAIVRAVDRVDLFHFDSDKSVSGRRFALDTLRPRLAPDAVIVMDDIQDNTFFARWVEDENLPCTVCEFGGKFIGLVGLDPP